MFRRGDEGEYEGWWEVVEDSPSPDLHGKIEWEPSVDSGTEIDLLVSKLAVPDGADVDVVCDDTVVLRVP
jgi:hypothetical protein